jgi:pimeloyl-ACP methyl ester carboxylesterase
MKPFKYFLAFIVLLLLIFISGPRVTFDDPKLLDTEINIPLSGLDTFVASRESQVSNLKANNQARIIWANDSLKQQTEYALVYLHGFSASQEEGAPIHTTFARRYGMNLYLGRLEDHGRSDSTSFSNLTPENYIQSAEDAIDIGKILGKKVIVMSCSTGGTLSALLTAAGEDIHSMIMYSPNIDIYDQKSDIIMYPWGKNIARIIANGDFNRIQYDSLAQLYWNPVYHINGIFAVKSIIRNFMKKEVFEKIKIPVFMGYYYKDEESQDKVVSVSRMHDFFNQISTPESLKRKVAFPDSGNHVISSHVMSNDVKGVMIETFKWAEEVLNLQAVQ